MVTVTLTGRSAVGAETALSVKLALAPSVTAPPPRMLTRGGRGLLTPSRLIFSDDTLGVHAPVEEAVLVPAPSAMLQPAVPPPSSASEPVRRTLEELWPASMSITRK